MNTMNMHILNVNIMNMEREKNMEIDMDMGIDTLINLVINQLH
jgi:hypothetical protein